MPKPPKHSHKLAKIVCPECNAYVQATVLAERVYPADDNLDPRKFVFAECPACQNPLVGYSEVDPNDGWTPLTREWPKPERQFDVSIPRSIRHSLSEAVACFNTNAYMASAVMSGRAVEGICNQKIGGSVKLSLAKGLDALKKNGVIDEKLFQWGDALRKERNIGAHAGEESVSLQDARDSLDFAIAFPEYVYVLDEKYREYQERKAQKAKGKKHP